MRFLAAALLALAVAAPAAAARDRCNHPLNERTVALNHQARVYVGEEGFYYGCIRRTGRTTELWEDDELYIVGHVRTLAGRFVSYTWSESPGCKADCPPDVGPTIRTQVTDLATHRTRTLSRDYDVYRTILRPSGIVAWVEGAAPESSLSVWAPGGTATLLDQGDIHDVRAANGQLTWTNSDGAHSAPFGVATTAGRDRCRAAGRHTIALTPVMRVYEDAGTDETVACARRTGARTSLFTDDGIEETGAIRAVAGGYVAYEVTQITDCRLSCDEAPTSETETFVAQAGTARVREISEDRVYALVLRPRGTVVWVTGAAPDSALWTWPRDSIAALLDQGDIHDVRAARGQLTWTNGGAPHSAPFA